MQTEPNHTDGSLIGGHASCGGIFRDHKGSFLSCFADNLGQFSVLEAELHGFIIAMEFVVHHHWHHLWLEGDSSSALSALKNPKVIPFRLRNRQHNCLYRGLQVIASHIYREGNRCADNLANDGHSIHNVVWWETLPLFIREEFFQDRFGIPYFRFLQVFVVSICLYFRLYGLFYEGFCLAPSCDYFFLF